MAAKSGGKMLFCKTWPVDSADTLWVKHFVEIALFHSVSEINTFLHFRRNSRWLPKVVGKRFFGKVASRLCRYPASQKFHQNRSISLHFRDKSVFAEIQDGCQKWREKVASRLCRYPVGQKFCQNCSISLCFLDKCVFCV